MKTRLGHFPSVSTLNRLLIPVGRHSQELSSANLKLLGFEFSALAQGKQSAVFVLSSLLISIFFALAMTIATVMLPYWM